MLKKDVNVTRLDKSNRTRTEVDLAVETPLSIMLNGRHYFTAMVSPELLEEFITGHLFAQGFVNDLGEIEYISFKEPEGGKTADSETEVHVLTSDRTRSLGARNLVLSGCGSTSNFLEKLPQVKSELKVPHTLISEHVNALLDSELFQATGCFHSCALINKDGDAVSNALDVGRHNALDKVIGIAALNGVNFSDVFVVTTGRIASDMILKCARTGIPLIASKAAVTSLALRIAEQSNVTIVGFVRNGRMEICNGEGRVI